MRTLRDAVHGDISLTTDEVAVLDTPQMQRLRGIRQLGAAYYVYPAAQHSRFEHSIGTLWMARRMLAFLAESDGYDLTETEERAVCLAALVHDVTHIPFGHTFEDERRLLPRHDDSRTRFEHFLCGEGELGRALAATEPGRLAVQLLGPAGNIPEDRACLRDIVSGTIGTICADLLDYLRRDNYFCGLSCLFDDRIFHYFRIYDGRLALALAKGGLFRPDALSEVTNLLRIRYILSERVYYHHAKMAAGVMISRAVERAFALGLTELNLCSLTDDALIRHLSDRFGDDEELAGLVSAYAGRRLYKRACLVTRSVGEGVVAELVRDYHMNEQGRRGAAERRIADALGVPAWKVGIYCAPEGMALKEADVPVILPGRELALLSSLNRDEIRVLQQQHRSLWRLFVFIAPEAMTDPAAAERACTDALGLPNELPRQRRGALHFATRSSGEDARCQQDGRCDDPGAVGVGGVCLPGQDESH